MIAVRAAHTERVFVMNNDKKDSSKNDGLLLLCFLAFPILGGIFGLGGVALVGGALAVVAVVALIGAMSGK